MISTIIAVFFFFVTQTYYQKVHVYYQRTYAVANRVVMRIEELDGSVQTRKVVVSGEITDSQGFGTNSTTFDDVISNDRGMRSQYVGIGKASSTYSLRKFVSFMNGFIGTDYECVTLEEALPGLQSDEYLQMPVWPNEGSVRIIDDIIFVKMGHYRWLEVKKEDEEYLFRLKAENQENVYYRWQVYKDSERILQEDNGNSTYQITLEDSGTYYVRLYVKETESGKNLFNVVSEEFLVD